jgi:hypothetical protein
MQIPGNRLPQMLARRKGDEWPLEIGEATGSRANREAQVRTH